MIDKEQLIQAGQYLFTNQLAWGTSGNMSVRVNADTMLITASGTHMNRLNLDDFTECEIVSGKVTGTKKASKETPMHLGIYREREDINAVLHSSPFYVTLFSCSDMTIYSRLFVESMYYLENIAYVDYFHPGTQQLADAITAKAKETNIIIMRHHGVVVFDKNISEAIIRLETLEMVCRMILQAKASGVQLSMLSEGVVKSFLEESGYRPRQLPSAKKQVNQ